MFTGTFRCLQSVGSIEQAAGQDEQRHLTTFKPVVDDEGNRKVWNGTPDGAVQLGRLPPGVAYDFKLGQKYKVTIEPID